MNTTETKMIAIRETTASGKSTIYVGISSNGATFQLLGKLGGKRAGRAAAVVVGNLWNDVFGIVGCRQTMKSAALVAAAIDAGRAVPVIDAATGVSVWSYMNGTAAVA